MITCCVIVEEHLQSLVHPPLLNLYDDDTNDTRQNLLADVT
jgi:hypothetical protein